LSAEAVIEIRKRLMEIRMPLCIQTTTKKPIKIKSLD